MKKILLTIAVVALLFATAPSFMASAKRNEQAGKSNKAHLYLYEKENFVKDGWDIVEDGAWGKMTYDLSGETFDYVFNGHELEEGMDYTLIYYPDTWPGKGFIYLGEGTANEYGDVHIKNSVGMHDNLEDAKLWLVLSNDVENYMIGWNPIEYLFEYDTIDFDYTM